MSDELAVHEPAEIVAFTPVAAAMQILGANKDFDVDKLGAILELQMTHEANEARKAYHVAMAAFKENPPKIIKDKNVKYTNQKGQTTSYNHAKLGNVTSIISSALSKQGLTASWPQEQTDKGIKVSCRITHILGHSEETSLTAAPDASGGKNPIQAIGSTVSYLQRYTILAITGLATDDQDDDGIGGAGNQPAKTTQPTADEAKAIGKVFDALLDSVPDDKMIDLDEFTKLMYSRGGNKYPQLEGLVASDWAKWVIKGKWLNLACKLKTNN